MKNRIVGVIINIACSTPLRIFVSLASIAIIVRKVAWPELGRRLDHILPTPLCAALLFVLLQFPLAGFRWKLVLKACGAQANLIHLQILTWICRFINQIIPSSLGGDAFRGYAVTAAYGIQPRIALSSLVLDRVMGTVGLLLQIVVTAPLLLIRTGSDHVRTVVAIAAMSLAAVIGLAIVGRLLLRPQAKVGGSLRLNLQQVIAEAARQPVLLWASIGMTVATNVAVSVAAYFLACALNVGLSFLDALALIPVGLFAANIPISLAGWGIRESVLILLFQLIGLSAADSLSLSVLFGLTLTVATLPGAFFWLTYRFNLGHWRTRTT